MPNVVVIAGPNGAGKSTVAPMVLSDLLGIGEFVNADVIARGLSGFNPEAAAFQAGRIMLERLRELAAQGADFAFETTLASRSFAPWIAGLIEEGYRFRLVYVWAPSPEFCVNRVAGRVRSGGHHVEAEVIRRRYAGGLRNFFGIYRPLAHLWRVYDNSRGGAPRLVARGHHGETDAVYDEEVWRLIERGGNRADRS